MKTWGGKWMEALFCHQCEAVMNFSISANNIQLNQQVRGNAFFKPKELFFLQNGNFSDIKIISLTKNNIRQ